jgi:outer membrane protein insertion porin family
LGIPRFTPWYYIWRFLVWAKSPRLLDREVVANDMDRINLYYENLGFFEAEVDTNIIEFRENRFEVSFLINEGPGLFKINTVSYTGLPDFEEDITLKTFTVTVSSPAEWLMIPLSATILPTARRSFGKSRHESSIS